jgi:hypothetical protein
MRPAAALLIFLSGCAATRTAWDPAGPCAQVVLHQVTPRHAVRELWRDGERVDSPSADLQTLLRDDPEAVHEARKAAALNTIGFALFATGLLESVISGVFLGRDLVPGSTQVDDKVAPALLTMGLTLGTSGLITLGFGMAAQGRAIHGYEERSGRNGCQE